MIYNSSRDEYIYNSSRVESSRVESSRVESSRLLTACVSGWHVSVRPPRTDTAPDDGAWATGHDHNAGIGLSPFPRTYGPTGARDASHERRSASPVPGHMDPEGRVTHRVSEGRLIITSPLRYRAAERKSVAVRNREDRKCVTRSNQQKFERSNVMASGGDQNHLPVSLAVSISVRTLAFLVGLRSDNGRKVSEDFRSCEAALTASGISDRIRLQNLRSCEAALNASDSWRTYRTR